MSLIKTHRGAGWLIFSASLILGVLGLVSFTLVDGALALSNEEFQVIDTDVHDVLQMKVHQSIVARDSQLYQTRQVGESKDGYFTYTVTPPSGRRQKWRAFWSIPKAGARPQVSSIELLPD